MVIPHSQQQRSNICITGRTHASSLIGSAIRPGTPCMYVPSLRSSFHLCSPHECTAFALCTFLRPLRLCLTTCTFSRLLVPLVVRCTCVCHVYLFSPCVPVFVRCTCVCHLYLFSTSVSLFGSRLALLTPFHLLFGGNDPKRALLVSMVPWRYGSIA